MTCIISNRLRSNAGDPSHCRFINITLKRVLSVDVACSNQPLGYRPGKTCPTSLSRGDVHLWWMQMPLVGGIDKKKTNLYDKCQHFLNGDELVEWDRVRQDGYKETAKADRLVARAYLRSVLARYSADTGSENAVSLSCDNLVKEPRSLQLDINAHGKPRLLCTTTLASNKDCGVLSRLEFNLSHSHGIIGVAVSYIDSVGLDVEHRKRKMRKDVDLKLARRYFSPTEQEILQAVPPGEERNALFLKIWTLKEAYVKAIGRGIGAPPGLQSFSFSFTHTSDARDSIEMQQKQQEEIRFEPSQSEPQTSWRFHLMQPTDSHIAAVCHQSSPSFSNPGQHWSHQEKQQDGYMYIFKSSTFSDSCQAQVDTCITASSSSLASGSSSSQCYYC